MDETLDPADPPQHQVERIAKTIDVSSAEDMAALKDCLMRALYLQQNLHRAYHDDRPTHSQIRKNLRKKWLPKARTLKALVDDLDEHTKAWLVSGAVYPVKRDNSGSEVSIPRSDEPNYPHLGGIRIDRAIEVIEWLPHYIEEALRVRGKADTGPKFFNHPVVMFVAQLRPFYEYITKNEADDEGRFPIFVTEALKLIPHNLPKDSKRQIIQQRVREARAAELAPRAPRPPLRD